MCDGELLLPVDPNTGRPWYNPKTPSSDSDSEDEEGRFIRKIKVGDKTTLWRRFTLLPFVPGQKYTIGTTFIGRVEQGEFIFLAQEQFPGIKEHTVCEIVVEDEKYFVSPTSEDSAVFLNQVHVGERTELAFGDKLWFEQEEKRNVFLFKEREMNRNADVKVQSSKSENENPNPIEFPLGQVGLIVSNILSNLSVKELKELRFVSKLWNEEASKHLRKRCTVHLDFDNGYEDSRESMKLFRYLVEMRNNPLSNWFIDIPAMGLEVYEPIDPTRGRPGDKLLEDVNYLLHEDNEDIRQSLKTLEIEGFIRSQLDYDVRLKLLQAFGGSMTEFTWGGCWYIDTATGKDYPFPDDIQFRKLKVFTLCLDILEDWSTADDCSSLTWLQPFIKATQRVTTIRLECYAELSLTFLNILTNPEILSLFSNLADISVQNGCAGVIKSLLKLVKPLTKLELYDFVDLEKQEFKNFELLLRKHSKTLKTLLFVIPPSPEDEMDTPPVVMSFPAFPQLQKLVVGYYPGRQFDIQDIKLTFPTGPVNYKNDLPSLKSLRLWPKEFEDNDYTEMVTDGSVKGGRNRIWQSCRCFYELFFPSIIPHHEEKQTVESLQSLSAIHTVKQYGKLRNGKSKRCRLLSKEMEAQIATMFPNVKNNEWINSIRDEVANKEKIKKGANLKPKSKVVDQPRRSLRIMGDRKLRSKSGP